MSKKYSKEDNFDENFSREEEYFQPTTQFKKNNYQKENQYYEEAKTSFLK